MTTIPLRLALPVAGAGFGTVQAVFVEDNTALAGLPVPAQIGLGYLALGTSICFLLMAGPLSVRRALATALVIAGIGSAALVASTLVLAPVNDRTLLQPHLSGVYDFGFVLFCLATVPLAIRLGVARRNWLAVGGTPHRRHLWRLKHDHTARRRLRTCAANHVCPAGRGTNPFLAAIVNFQRHEGGLTCIS